MRRYVIYNTITGQPVTARWTERAARRYCRGKFNLFRFVYER